ncbi:hypothetical protein KDD17_16450 [Sulfitobacter albidus]|uniref:Lectin-like protein BA14k n=1 Tax=Sulfitobacter albidus TaxID=2829501 RepID=A0A975JDH7_9RHOB|nr:hypothetical protein [Sulfitobacter albidus]QUJ76448.1 hypothetical protein KDD17_16450 [Sulfitobacter albidus]
MRLALSSRFLSTLAATALALTAFTAAPAYADDDRTARALATILGLAIVGKIIHDERKDDKEKRKARQQVYKPQAHTHRHGHLTHRHHDGQVRHSHRSHQPKPRPLPRRVDRKQLPKHCFRSYDTRQGTAYMFGRRCLERSYQFVNRLPQACAQRIRTYDGKRRGYNARCLRRNGYSLARG